MGLAIALVVFGLMATTAESSEELCLICKCSTINIQIQDGLTQPNTNLDHRRTERDWSPITPVPDPRGEYLAVNCSSGRIGAKWPPVTASGIWGDFPRSGLDQFPAFPDEVKRKMIKLSLSGNRIQETVEADLEDYHRLRILDLSRNRIRHVAEFSFSHTKRLAKLDLSRNEIDEIGRWSADSSLLHLNLADNVITVVRAESLRGFKNLAFLDLSNNRLTHLPDSFGSSLTALKFLYLFGNQFEVVPRLPRFLFAVDMSSNILRTLVLPQIDDLFVLDVSNNNLDDLDNVYEQLSLKVLRASHNYLSKLGEWKTTELQILDLGYNNLKTIPKEINSRRLPRLQELYLDGNPLTDITVYSGSEPFPELDVLGLSSLRNITHINHESFKGILMEAYVNCSEERGLFVNLSSNNLKDIDANTFTRFPICSIDLSNNLLTTIPANLFAWQNLTSANLQSNPWNCICDQQWMLDVFLPHFYRKQPQLLLDMRCATPSRFKNRMFAYWYNATGKVFCRGPSYYQYEYEDGKYIEIWTVSMIACAVLGVLICVVLIAILVLLFVKPNRKNANHGRRNKRTKPLFSELKINPDHKYNEIPQEGSL